MTGNVFQIDCVCCKKPVSFSIAELETPQHHTSCLECGKKYGLQDETLKRQLKMFAALCHQIQQSEEILGNASVAVDVGPHNVKIPFKLLLTRLKSTLDLQVGDVKLVVTYRVQPIQKK
jgi:hypothetical protein